MCAAVPEEGESKPKRAVSSTRFRSDKQSIKFSSTVAACKQLTEHTRKFCKAVVRRRLESTKK